MADSGPAVTAVPGSEAQEMVGTVALAITFIQAGRLRALASTGARRSRLSSLDCRMPPGPSQ